VGVGTTTAVDGGVVGAVVVSLPHAASPMTNVISKVSRRLGMVASCRARETLRRTSAQRDF
jgi:hypothetical protein